MAELPLEKVLETHEYRKLYSTGRAALFLRCSVATLLRWCQEGNIDFTRLDSGHRRFWREELIRVDDTHIVGQKWAPRAENGHSEPISSS
jgi:excisionase family DNA binding protein